MSDLDYPTALRALARELGIHTQYADGFGTQVEVADETLVAASASLGVDAGDLGRVEAARAWLRRRAEGGDLEPVIVAWDGRLTGAAREAAREPGARIELEDGSTRSPRGEGAGDGPAGRSEPGGRESTRPGTEESASLPWGYHQLVLEHSGGTDRATVISAPRVAYRRPGSRRSWGLGTHAAALRSARSRAIADLVDLERVGRWVGEQGGDLITVLPLLPTFNETPSEPSPYSAVSRLFWSELVVDLGDRHRPVPRPQTLSVERAAREVREALADEAPPPDLAPGDEVAAYARFRGAQRRLGRNWRAWPEAARLGTLHPVHVDPAEESFHLAAQIRARRQIDRLVRNLGSRGVALGLDLPVGTHPDGYDTWSRPALFAPGMSVGAPPDPGFANGQNWGFPPILPSESRAEGHRYLAASIAHQARVAGVLRIDHVMAWARLFWIPSGADGAHGTYVSYPMEELFAVLCLESHRHRCEVIGENLGTVPESIREALPAHGIDGFYLAQFAAAQAHPEKPSAHEVAAIGSHDTPTLAGWIAGADIEDRVRFELLSPESAATEADLRREAVDRLAQIVARPGADSPMAHDPVAEGPAAERSSSDRARDPDAVLEALLYWLGASDSPRVVPWIEDLWLEPVAVNLPGTASQQRANWQRPMSRLLDEILDDPVVLRRIQILATTRRGGHARRPRHGTEEPT